MGVTVLQTYNVLEGKTGPQTIEFLAKRLLALGARPAGQFLVDCETHIYTSQHGPSKAVHVLHNSEYPASVFSILETGTKQVPIIADGLFDLLMLKIISTYTSKKQPKIESKGARFEYGDFLIKLGSVTLSENFKGILIEVEYRVCNSPSNCLDMMRELLKGFLGSDAHSNLSYFASSYPGINNQKPNEMFNPSLGNKTDTYQPIDTINQYLEHFINYRKQTAIGGGNLPLQATPA